ncbi:MAG TPA: type II toxin-antitoxin system HicA family toxin [Mycobacteriales bacterium]|nr:type II toxin-antitoxin system HicA family toxin [Mycobacteriales bacterium]
MTPAALPRGLSGADIARALKRGGFEFVSSRGSHHKYRDGTGHTVIVPQHREVAPGTLRSILRQAGWDTDTLTTYL